MKYVAFIFSIYILTLNFVPCGDEIKSDENTHIEISENITNEHQHNNCSVCSPFCLCNCCHINIISFTPISFCLTTINNGFKTNFFYLENIKKDILRDILQPPKI